MKKLLKCLVCVLCLGCLFFTSACNDNSGKTKIGIVQIVEHESLDTIRDSIIAELRELGYTEDNTIIYTKSAAGEMTMAQAIVQEFNSKKCDIIIPIATPTAMAASQVAKFIPVVFAAVSDPIGAGLTTSLDTPDKGVTGTCDEIQVEQIMDLAIKIDNDLATLGVVYNPSEANSVSNINRVKAYCLTKGITVKEVAINNASEISTNIQSLKGKVDAIFTPNDNTVATKAGMNMLGSFARENKIPLYVGADSMVSDGGFATVGINYVELGQETAKMADQILKGKAIKDIPVKVFKENLKIYVNESVLTSLGITLPEDITSSQNYQKVGE